MTDLTDAWITLAAIANVTGAIRLGPMVTPLARRRPVKVARETATLDRLSDGRLTLGVGLGTDRSGNELSITGEELDDRRRASMLDESLEILTAAWTGEPVHHRSTSLLPSWRISIHGRSSWNRRRTSSYGSPSAYWDSVQPEGGPSECSSGIQTSPH